MANLAGTTKKVLTPTLTKQGTYQFSETLVGGYLQRGSYSHNTIVSEWTKDFKLVKFTINDRDNLYFFDAKGKLRKDIKKPEKGKFHSEGDFYFGLDGGTAIRAYNRHLASLKVFFGLEKLEEIKKAKFIYRTYWDGKIMGRELPLTKTGAPNFKELGRQKIPIVPYTEEGAKLGKEYNEKLEAWEKERRRLTDLIFGKD